MREIRGNRGSSHCARLWMPVDQRAPRESTHHLQCKLVSPDQSHLALIALIGCPNRTPSDFITIINYQYINYWILCIRNGRRYRRTDGHGEGVLSHFVHSKAIINSAENVFNGVITIIID